MRALDALRVEGASTPNHWHGPARCRTPRFGLAVPQEVIGIDDPRARLLPIIRRSKEVWLHIYTPRVAASMRSFSDLIFYSISGSAAETWAAPAHVLTLLNLFAGQLYFDNREEYKRICIFLALHMAHPGGAQIEVDGFVLPAHRTGEDSPFTTSAIATFKQLTGLRRKRMGYGSTDLGRVLNVRPLGNDPESSRN